MAIGIFQNGWKLKDIREAHLNKAIEAVDLLNPKVDGLQTVVALSMTHPSVDVPNKRIVFKQGGAGNPQYLELGPMLDTYKHGIDVRGERGGNYVDIFKLMFKNGTVTQSGGEVVVDIASVRGKVGTGTERDLKYISLTGNLTGTTLDNDGRMTINIPDSGSTIIGQVGNGAELPIEKIRVVGHKDNSTCTNDTLSIDIPDPVVGSIVGGTNKQLTEILVRGNTGVSDVDNLGKMTIDLPQQEADYNDTGYEAYHKIKIEGNKGNSRVEGQVLHIDLPAGGGGGASDLKVGTQNGTPVPDVGEIYFKDSEIQVDNTTKSGNKVLISHKGTPTAVETKYSDASKYVKQIKITGEIKDTEVSDSGLLTLHIPHHSGVTLEDGKTSLTAIEKITLDGATVKAAVGESDKATISIDRVQGQLLNGTESPVEKIKLTGDLGTSTLDAGLLTINLQQGGGGTGGGDITGVVGSEAGTVNRIEVTGNTTGSHVDAGNKIMKINIPKKATIRGSGVDVDNVDIVEIAHSVVEGHTESDGRQRALITPQIVMFYHGWYASYDQMDSDIVESKRIPTKTCAYAINTSTGQADFYVWQPVLGSTPQTFQWVKTKAAGALEMYDNGAIRAPICSVNKNPMVEVDGDGRLTIKDVTVPLLQGDILNQDGTSSLIKGQFHTLEFEDGHSVVTYDSINQKMRVHRAQRRYQMGVDPTGLHPEFANSEYEGSIFFNQDDQCWWGYHDIDGSTGQHKWSKIIHNNMSDQVIDTDARVPSNLKQVAVVDVNGDSLLWRDSGWTGVPKNANPGILPTLAQGQTGMVIQTFKGPTGSGVPDETGRIQIGYLGSDATMYKRYRDKTLNKWSEWVKMSFNPGDLAEHNKDLHAHRVSHPYYKTVTFDCSYKELQASGLWLPISMMHVLGSSDGRHKVNDDKICTVAYNGKYRIRGHIYFSGVNPTPSASDAGVWHLYISKRKKDTNPWVDLYTAEYDHNTTTMVYPPLSWDAENLELESGDDIKIGFRFDPKVGTVENWLKVHPDIGFYGLRSFVSVDEQENDGGFAIGETHRKLHGRFAAIGNYGVKVFYDKTQSRTRVVDDIINPNITQMMP